MEREGPLFPYFDFCMPDALWEEKTWEKAERKMLKFVIDRAAKKAGLNLKDIDAIVAGDLLNQIISSSFAARDFNMCFLGQYGACSTMSQSLIVGGAFVEGGHFKNVACAASSHFATAERQYRFPLELGCQRPPTAQRTVTGAGCTILTQNKSHIKINGGTIGKVTDWNISDANNMGAVMAPAAADTIYRHLKNTDTSPNDYDYIVTGDLGFFGKELCSEILKKDYSLNIDSVHIDCGCEIYTKDMDVDSGGSGCGCSASVFNGYLLKKMKNKEITKILLVATGAMLSLTTALQNETIPGIAHAVEIERLS